MTDIKIIMIEEDAEERLVAPCCHPHTSSMR